MRTARLFFVVPSLSLAFAFACGGGGSSSPDGGGSSSGAVGDDLGEAGVVPGDAAQAGDAPAGEASASDASAGAAAVQATITSNAACNTLPAFYWEIGDAHGALASGAVGTTYSATTAMNIASASKLVFGAYVVERFKSDLTQMDPSAMRMLSGYTSLNYDSCVLASSVQACLAAGQNGTHTPANDGRFYYDGGHFQNYAVASLGLGPDDDAKLAADIGSQVGTELGLAYSSPQLAAGIRTTPAAYAAFLRKILSGGLAIHDHLGENAVCTLPSACPTAVYSPSPLAWHYSYAHWVEDEPTTGDGAFSSPGAFGFYPWIDATKTYYGILARSVVGGGSYLESATCGRLLRKAFVTGTPQ
jgi:hypothetical protein